MLGIALVGGLVAGVIAMKLPQMIGIEIGEAIGRAGFAVRNVEIVGRQKADRDIVYDVAMEQQSRAMPLVDLEGTRAKLMQLGWIADARVSRRLPDTLVVDIVERKPAAIWQFQHRLSLIDKDGTVIAPVDDAAMPDLPIVIGPGANRQATELTTLLEAAPSLKPMLAGATWIGSRRWDLRFQSGETLALPEGPKAAAAALAYFAKQDAEVRLLGQGFVRFDLRDPKKMVVRVSKEPGRQVADPDTKSI
ncbi:MAG TPA: cell division protein FtsQ/DivIB [Allosphingosinicella sp.]|nr:cell division protein FtsQ/DivIB [Allosphingosinicella sp.]